MAYQSFCYRGFSRGCHGVVTNVEFGAGVRCLGLRCAHAQLRARGQPHGRPPPPPPLPSLPKVLSNVTINITDTKMSENPNTTKMPVHEARTSTRRRHRPDLQDSFRPFRPRARVVEGAVVASAEVRLHAAAAFSRFGGHPACERSQTSFVYLPPTDDCVRTDALRVSGQRPSMKGSQTLSLFVPMANLHRQSRECSPLNSRWKRVDRDHKPGHVSDDKTGDCGKKCGEEYRHEHTEQQSTK